MSLLHADYHTLLHLPPEARVRAMEVSLQDCIAITDPRVAPYVLISIASFCRSSSLLQDAKLLWRPPLADEEGVWPLHSVCGPGGAGDQRCFDPLLPGLRRGGGSGGGARPVRHRLLANDLGGQPPSGMHQVRGSCTCIAAGTINQGVFVEQNWHQGDYNLYQLLGRV